MVRELKSFKITCCPRSPLVWKRARWWYSPERTVQAAEGPLHLPCETRPQRGAAASYGTSGHDGNQRSIRDLEEPVLTGPRERVMRSKQTDPPSVQSPETGDDDRTAPEAGSLAH